jgi:predicted RNA methylase
MKKRIIFLVKSILPSSMVENFKHRLNLRSHKKKMKRLRLDILKYYENIQLNEEQKEVVEYLKNRTVSVFPYPFADKYVKDNVEVFRDEEKGLLFVIHEGKRLYFKRSMTINSVKSLYCGLQMDQDLKSPHLYLEGTFDLSKNDVIADVGAAEGNFSLSNIDRVKKVYLFEYDKEWVEALKATFEPWKEKVVIVDKFVTDKDSDSTIDIHNFYNSHPDINFFKVDIEGEEQKFLNACEPIFKDSTGIKLAICTYHKQNDEKDFTKQLVELGFKVTPSKGYMIFIFDDLIAAPFLRKGLLRVEK